MRFIIIGNHATAFILYNDRFLLQLAVAQQLQRDDTLV